MSENLLNQCFDYNPETGRLLWKTRPRDHFKCEHGWKSFNGKLAGKDVGTLIKHPTTGKTYQMFEMNGRTLYAHRVIWELLHGEKPEQIDHINGDGTDNRSCNLRAADRQTNARNQRLRYDSTTNVTGVVFDKAAKGLQRWRSRIADSNGNRKSKRFYTLFDAVCWRKSKEIEYDYHENHGEVRPL